ncbi:MAG: flagellar motor switch protein FliM [Deltaproteobacteria bacterium]|nr:flagellar motor switch protein FliM [Deltaproteobacteria bacterium]
MAQTLSQEEVDTLLQGIDKGDVPVEESSREHEDVGKAEGVDPSVDVRPYDFSHSDVSIHHRLPGLEIIFSKVSRSLRNLFVSELGRSVDAGFNEMDVVTYEEFIKRLPLPSSIHLVKLEPLRGLGVYVIEARLAYAMVDIFFGGSGERLEKIEGRDFTPIESSFLGRFVEKMLIGMEEAWKSMISLKGSYLRSESNPYLLGATAMGEVMVLATYRIDLVQVTGDILFAFPLSALEELREQLKSPFPIVERDSAWVRSRMDAHLLDIEVSVQAVVDQVAISLEEVLRLHPGDILQIDPQCMDRVELWVEGKPRFCGRAAQTNGVKVFAVSGRMKKTGSNAESGGYTDD